MIRKLVVFCVGLLLILSWSATPTFARRAITVTEGLVSDTSDSATLYDTGSGVWDHNGVGGADGSFILAGDQTGICAFTNTDSVTPSTVSMNQTNETWTEVANVLYNTIATPLNRLTVFKATGSGAGTSTPQFDVSAGTGNQTSAGVRCYKIDGNDTGAVLQSQTEHLDSTTVHTLTLASGRTANSLLIHFVSINGNQTWTHEYANTGTESNWATPTTDSTVQWVIGGSDTTPLSTANGAQPGGQIAVEIAIAGGGGGGATPCFWAMTGLGCN